jgi:hypothetical protein
VPLYIGSFADSTVSDQHHFELGNRFRCLSYQICTSIITMLLLRII